MQAEDTSCEDEQAICSMALHVHWSIPSCMIVEAIPNQYLGITPNAGPVKSNLNNLSREPGSAPSWSIALHS